MQSLIHIARGAVLALAAATAVAGPDGAALYAHHCAVCHGDQGHGGVGVPLALPAFINTVTDEYLATTIRRGRPGRVMPGFTQLSDAEVRAIVDHLGGWRTEPPPEHDPAPITGDAERGAELYERHCATCHGEDGEGGKGTGVTFSRPRDLPIMPPALNNQGFLAAVTDSMIKRTLMEGREGTPMVSFRAAGLSEQDIDDLVVFVRGFEDAARPGPHERMADEPPLLVMDSPYDVRETVEAVKRAAIGKNFRIIREQYLEQGLFPEEAQNTRQVIIHFCNFKFLYEALAIDPRVGLFLPCRVTVVEGPEGVKVMSINPKRLSVLFNNSELDEACEQMYGVYRDILDEATL